MPQKSGTSLAIGITMLIAASVIVDAVFTGRKPWDIVLAVVRGEEVPKASAVPGGSAPYTGNGTAPLSGKPIVGAAGSVQAKIAVAYAMAQLGKPYMTGANRLGPNSFDCSGLIYRAAEAAGKIIGMDTYHQVKDGAPVPIDPNEVRPGDLLFYFGDRPAQVYGHVAMAISSTQQIAAPSPGQKVQIQPIRYTGDETTRVEAIRRIF